MPAGLVETLSRRPVDLRAANRSGGLESIAEHPVSTIHVIHHIHTDQSQSPEPSNVIVNPLLMQQSRNNGNSENRNSNNQPLTRGVNPFVGPEATSQEVNPFRNLGVTSPQSEISQSSSGYAVPMGRVNAGVAISAGPPAAREGISGPHPAREGRVRGDSPRGRRRGDSLAPQPDDAPPPYDSEEVWR